MGELLDRTIQLDILRALAEDYPANSDIKTKFGPQENNVLKVNLAYLNEHGLIATKCYPTHSDPSPLPSIGKITAAGLDFLADDGGISSILGVVTVRFEDETLKSLLIKRIDEEDADASVKAQMKAAVKAMPAEALKTIGQKMIEYGIAATPAGIAALRAHMGL